MLIAGGGGGARSSDGVVDGSRLEQELGVVDENVVGDALVAHLHGDVAVGLLDRDEARIRTRLARDPTSIIRVNHRIDSSLAGRYGIVSLDGDLDHVFVRVVFNIVQLFLFAVFLVRTA